MLAGLSWRKHCSTEMNQKSGAWKKVNEELWVLLLEELEECKMAYGEKVPA